MIQKGYLEPWRVRRRAGVTHSKRLHPPRSPEARHLAKKLTPPGGLKPQRAQRTCAMRRVCVEARPAADSRATTYRARNEPDGAVALCITSQSAAGRARPSPNPPGLKVYRARNDPGSLRAQYVVARVVLRTTCLIGPCGGYINGPWFEAGEHTDGEAGTAARPVGLGPGDEGARACALRSSACGLMHARETRHTLGHPHLPAPPRGLSWVPASRRCQKFAALQH